MLEWSRVGEDVPRAKIVKLVRILRSAGETIIAMSGRDGRCRQETQAWLDEHVGPGMRLFMREQGNNDRDSLVKHRLFHDNIAGRFNVEFILDDRDQVVTLWRTMGLECIQVARGAF